MSDIYQVQSIGIVESAYKKFGDKCDYQNDVNAIVVHERFEDGLLGTELFSNMFCVYFQHRQDDWKSFAGHTPDEQILKLPLTREPTCRGVFSKRSPARPARLGSCVITIVRREGRRLIVKGLDALDGSPVMDLKPYVPQFDAFPLATAPLHWCVAQTDALHTSRSLHWDTANVTVSLGMRAGMYALKLLGISRGEAVSASVTGPAFFAHGLEATTGCSFVTGTLTLSETDADGEPWIATVTGGGKRVEIRVRDGIYSGADEVLSLPENDLFEKAMPFLFNMKRYMMMFPNLSSVNAVKRGLKGLHLPMIKPPQILSSKGCSFAFVFDEELLSSVNSSAVNAGCPFQLYCIGGSDGDALSYTLCGSHGDDLSQ